MKKRKKKNSWSALGWLSCIFFFVIHLLFNDLGLIKMLELHSKKKLIQSEIEDIKIKINEKNKEIEALKTDFTYIEKIAREKYKMVKRGEKVYRVKDSRSIKN